MSTKALESIELAVAQNYLDEYSSEVMNGDIQSNEAVACERRLGQAIEALNWITRAEETIRQAVYRGLIDLSPDLDGALEALHRGWLAPCEMTEKLVQHQIDQGVPIKNLAEFRACCESARDWIERHEWAKAAQRSRERRFASEPW